MVLLPSFTRPSPQSGPDKVCLNMPVIGDADHSNNNSINKHNNNNNNKNNSNNSYIALICLHDEFARLARA